MSPSRAPTDVFVDLDVESHAQRFARDVGKGVHVLAGRVNPGDAVTLRIRVVGWPDAITLPAEVLSTHKETATVRAASGPTSEPGLALLQRVTEHWHASPTHDVVLATDEALREELEAALLLGTARMPIHADLRLRDRVHLRLGTPWQPAQLVVGVVVEGLVDGPSGVAYHVALADAGTRRTVTAFLRESAPPAKTLVKPRGNTQKTRGAGA
jgi:hypothetical protein